MASAPPLPQPIDFNQVLGQAAQGTGKLAAAAGAANLQGANLGASAFTSYLNSDGRVLTLDPNRIKELNASIASSKKALTKLNPAFTKATTAKKAAETELSKQQDAASLLAKKNLDSASAALEKAKANLEKNPNNKKLQGAVTKSEAALKSAQSFAENPTTKGLVKAQAAVQKTTGADDGLKSQIDTTNSTVSNANKSLVSEGPSITDTFRSADKQAYDAIDNAAVYANKLGQITPQGQTYLDAVGKGYTANEIKPTPIKASQVGSVADVQAQQINAAQAGAYERIASRDVNAAQIADTPQIGAINAARVRNISAQQVGQGQLGQSLYQTAQDRLALNGRLSSEASRDAVQASRAGFAARGMATGNSALAGELLNRDRYSQQRFQQDASFAQGVQNSDVSRQQQNAAMSLEAARANQAKATQLSLANQAAGMDAARANQAATMAVNQANAGYLQQANLANQDAALRASQLNQAAGMQTEQYNAGLRQSAAIQNQDAALRASQLNQATALSLGTTNAQLAQQAETSNQQNSLVAQTANEEARRAGTITNTGMAASAADFVDNQNKLGLSTQLGMSNVYSQSNPLLRNLTLGNTYANNGLGSQTMVPALDLAGNVASYNTNMQASIYNSYMNNNAALQGARLQSDATKAAGNSAMTGSIIGGAGAAVGGAAMAAACCWVARAAFGTATSRWTLYRRAMLRGASDRTIRLYCQYGPAIATRITTPLRRRLARIILCTLELAWK
jgi:hypothetical protein